MSAWAVDIQPRQRLCIFSFTHQCLSQKEGPPHQNPDLLAFYISAPKELWLQWPVTQLLKRYVLQHACLLITHLQHGESSSSWNIFTLVNGPDFKPLLALHNPFTDHRSCWGLRSVLCIWRSFWVSCFGNLSPVSICNSIESCKQVVCGIRCFASSKLIITAYEEQTENAVILLHLHFAEAAKFSRTLPLHCDCSAIPTAIAPSILVPFWIPCAILTTELLDSKRGPSSSSVAEGFPYFWHMLQNMPVSGLQ